MKNSKMWIIRFCFLLSLGIFGLDLCIPWAAGGILYLTVILIALQLHEPKYTVMMSLLATGLIIIDFIVTLPPIDTWRVLINHIFVLFILWLSAVLGLLNKKKHKNHVILSSIIRHSTDAIFGRSLDGIITSWNKGAELIYGYQSREIIGKPGNITIPADRLNEEPELLQQIQEGKSIKHFETIRKHKDGTFINVSLSISPIHDAAGKIIGSSSIARDITERVMAEKTEKELSQKMVREKQKLEEVLSLQEEINNTFNLNKLIDLSVEKTTQILGCDRCSLMMMDSKKSELCIKGHKGIDDQIVLNQRKSIDELISGTVAKSGVGVLVKDISIDERFQQDNRKNYYSGSFISVPIKLGDQVKGVLNVANKQGENKIFTELDFKIINMICRQLSVGLENARLVRDLEYLSITDPLTEAYNFRQFAKTLDQEVIRAKLYNVPLFLILIDMDNLKSYNDQYGEQEGDIVLQKISNIFKENIRPVDFFCRYSSDEFAIILPHVDKTEAVSLIEKLTYQIAETLFERRVTISSGIAQFHSSLDRHTFITKARMALNQAKKNGKNRVNIIAH